MANPSESFSEPIGLSYASYQLRSAFEKLTQETYSKNQSEASGKVAKWANLLEKIANVQLHIGSRTPLPKVPAWITLEVVHGGFATGNFAAGGALLPHEIALLKKLGANAGGRRALNYYYLSDEGLSQLQRWLQSGQYAIPAPEEGALLTIAYLLQHDEPGAVIAILEKIGPWFDTLRFYPEPSEHCIDIGSNIHLQSVEQVIGALGKKGPHAGILAQKEFVQVWAPLYDRIVDLFLDTVEGDLPTLATDSNGKWHRSGERKFPVTGGWPCQKYSETWKENAQHILQLFAREATLHKFCSRPKKHKASLAKLINYLKKCVNDPTQLSGRDVGMIRLLIARSIAKRGPPNSERCQSYRLNQRKHVEGPMFEEIAKLLTSRLYDYPGENGIDEIEKVVQPVSIEESHLWGFDKGMAIPKALEKKVQRARKGTIEQLVAEGLISSSEVLAGLLPQITANVISAALEDINLRRLYLTMYNAFRKRRSLLLLNYEKQVRLEELPWIEALRSYVSNLPTNLERSRSLDYQHLARQTMIQVVQLTLKAFPHVIIPNRMVEELITLSKESKMGLPLTKEVAADIFMGDFSSSFVKAAQTSGMLLHDSLYEAYYKINYQEISRLNTDKDTSYVRRKQAQACDSPTTFRSICEERAGEKLGRPARNGMIIEQQQILTTHNLAVLYQALLLENSSFSSSSSQLEDMALRCFKFVCKQLRRNNAGTRYRLQLINLKKSAYAWRQMVFWLSLLSKREQVAFMDRLATYYNNSQPRAFRERFSPAFDELKLAVDIHCHHNYVAGSRQRNGRVFTGWSVKKHWLITPSSSTQNS